MQRNGCLMVRPSFPFATSSMRIHIILHLYTNHLSIYLSLYRIARLNLIISSLHQAAIRFAHPARSTTLEERGERREERGERKRKRREERSESING